MYTVDVSDLQIAIIYWNFYFDPNLFHVYEVKNINHNTKVFRN